MQKLILLAMAAIQIASGSELQLAMNRIMAGRQGTAVLLDIRSRRVLAVYQMDTAARLLARPGSTMKPIALITLLRNGKLTKADQFVCPQTVELADRNFTCSHPKTSEPFDAASAIAFSCNAFVTHFAERFKPGELASAFRRFGLDAPTGLAPGEAVGRVTDLEGELQEIQSIGEEGVEITPLELLMAYRRLALESAPADPRLWPVFQGMFLAVDSGTAQNARTEGLRVAGKTGTATSGQPGVRRAWFAGYAPAEAPEVALVVMVTGGSGGADAAPLAGKILAAYRKVRHP